MFRNVITSTAITRTYNKANGKIKKKINKKRKKIVKKSLDNIVDRMDVKAEFNCFLTNTNQKAKLLNHPKVSVINPGKNKLGKISKTSLDNISRKLFEATKINQWKSTVSAIKWLNYLKDQHLIKFIMLDIQDFYPAITKDLLNKDVNFAKEYINTLKCDTDVIYHARKSLLFNKSHTWIKKEGLFDVTMGAYDGGV